MKKDEIIMASIFGAVGMVFAFIAFSVLSPIAKWIWGILAVLVIGFTIVATIDSIVKSRRRKKDFTDLFKNAIKESISKPDFQERMSEASDRREKLYEGQLANFNREDFGYSLENPIMTSSVFRSDDYLGKLRTEDGKKLTWDRTGSYCMREIHGVENVMVDAYQLFLDGKEYKVIYVCPYGHSSSVSPQGLKLVE